MAQPKQLTFSEQTLGLRIVTKGDEEYPEQMRYMPRFRYMGNKTRLLGWIHSILKGLEFRTAADVFCGSGAVSYLLKSMGKQVHCCDFLNFPSVMACALIANSDTLIPEDVIETLLKPNHKADTFIQNTFRNIFYTDADLKFLDNLSANLRSLPQKQHDLALTALIRACMKRQPRGVFTVGDPNRYRDGRRDLKLSVKELFLEQLAVCNAGVFSNGHQCTSEKSDIFHAKTGWDLVYLDPPYVPRSDDNCYMKRYHFLEGLSCYWQGQEILWNSKVKKIKKPFTPFSYRANAVQAFDSMFHRFADSTLVLSYSSNAFPDLEVLVSLMGKYKRNVAVHAKPYHYHFGTHSGAKRNSVEEYLVVGT